MNTPSDTSRLSAVSNALSSIRKDVRLPKKVLVGPWEDYLFFEPHMLFEPDFIEAKDSLLIAEKASVIALINLGNVIPINYKDPPTLFIDYHTEANQYVSELESKGAALNWRVLMDRYVCASDKGSWSIYCEKENDVAVFAFREGLSQLVRSQVARLLRAKSIRFSCTTGDSQLFDFGKLIPDWRYTLATEHVPSTSGGNQ